MKINYCLCRQDRYGAYETLQTGKRYRRKDMKFHCWWHLIPIGFCCGRRSPHRQLWRGVLHLVTLIVAYVHIMVVAFFATLFVTYWQNTAISVFV